MAEKLEENTICIEEQIQAALAEAHTICDQLGSRSKQCAVAWNAVEDLKTEVSD